MPGNLQKPANSRSLSLRTRMLLGVSTMLLPLFLLGGGVLFSVQYLGAAFEEALDDPVNEMHEIMSLQAQVALAAKSPNDYLIHGEPTERERFAGLAASVNRDFAKALKLVSLWPSQETLLEKAHDEWQRAQTIAETLLAEPSPVGNAAAAENMKRMDSHVDQVLAILLKAHEVTRNELDGQMAYARNLQHRTVLLIVVATGLLSLFVSAASSILLARFVLSPLRKLEAGATRLGAGEYSHRVTIRTGDELEHLAGAFNAMAEELQKDYARLEELSTHDGLTGLYNHRMFHRLLSEELVRAKRFDRPMSLLMVDLDHFKQVNDNYGHQAGDRVLRGVSDLLREQSRSIDRVCRYGGEEIMLILPEVATEAALVSAERLRRLLEQSAFDVGEGRMVRVTASIGLASFPFHADEDDGLIHAADMALYAAKHAGRNRVCLDPSQADGRIA